MDVLETDGIERRKQKSNQGRLTPRSPHGASLSVLTFRYSHWTTCSDGV